MGYGLYPNIKRRFRKPKHRITSDLKDAQHMLGVTGPMWHTSGGACCLSCRRYLEPGLISPKYPTRRILSESCCQHCGRTKLDMALIEHGVIAVARMYAPHEVQLAKEGA